VSRLCLLFGVSTSGFYAWKARPVSAHAQHDHVLTQRMLSLHSGLRRAYGAPRLHQLLRQKGYVCSRRRVARLMRNADLCANTVGLYPNRASQHEFYASTPNHLKTATAATRCGEQWVADFTYLKTQQGWLYMAAVMDMYSRRIVGWSFSRKRGAELTTSALRMALQRHPPSPGCLLHTDQGIEYQCFEFRDYAEHGGLVRSMSRKARPLDNAHMESFFHTMKAELVHQCEFDNDIAAVAHIVQFVEFYNRERLHSALRYQSPEKYEKLSA
jgi:transposase InsO family protein